MEHLREIIIFLGKVEKGLIKRKTMICHFKGSIKVVKMTEENVMPYLEKMIKSSLSSSFVYQPRNNNLFIELKDFEIDVGRKILKFINSNQTQEYQTYHVVEHLLLRIFLESHPCKFGFNTEYEKRKIIRGLDSCMIVSSSDNTNYFQTTRELFKLFDENKNVFSEEEKNEIEMCKELMAKIQHREGKPFKSYRLKIHEK